MTMLYYRSERFDFEVAVSNSHTEYKSKTESFELKQIHGDNWHPHIVAGHNFDAVFTDAELIVVTGEGCWRRPADWLIWSVFEIEAGILLVEELRAVTLTLGGEQIAETMFHGIPHTFDISRGKFRFTDFDQRRKLIYDLPTLQILEDLTLESST
jgi:hypothetical protein